ncbi:MULTISPECIES: hypothetical protein [Comamonas]|uniref:hypothetical protein n=1 Tax=Comamonas TaxID=283 RepID=UPI00257B14A8|nr:MULTISPECIES: hypothetical protein [Comamonas]
MLRRVSYVGRDVVRETARIMRMLCTWPDGEIANNTARGKGVQVQVHVTMNT